MGERTSVRGRERLGYPKRETWTKACNCRASASGPRLVYHHETLPNGDFLALCSYVKLACDECDTPWEKEPSDADG